MQKKRASDKDLPVSGATVVVVVVVATVLQVIYFCFVGKKL